MTPVSIHENELAEAAEFLQGIPEFRDIQDAAAIRERLDGVAHLVLTAWAGENVAGCKIGYERDGRFYSWLGAVGPAYREHGIARQLADYQEAWAKRNGYSSIWMKTRNAFPAMLLMALRRGFTIIAVEPREDHTQNRVLLEKFL